LRNSPNTKVTAEGGVKKGEAKTGGKGNAPIGTVDVHFGGIVWWERLEAQF